MSEFGKGNEPTKVFSMRKLTRKAVKLYQIFKLDADGSKVYLDVCSNTTNEDILKWADGGSAWHNGIFYDQVGESGTMELPGYKDVQVVLPKRKSKGVDGVSKLKCIECGAELDDKETKEYYDDSKYCCTPTIESPCGCMGLPLDPPLCNECCETV